MKKIYQLISYVLLLILVSHFDLLSQVYINAQASGSNDGTSWTNAYTGITDALATAPSGSEIWIAQVKYIQSQRISIIDKSFKIYGSFVGTETSLEQRDFANGGNLSSLADMDEVLTDSTDITSGLPAFVDAQAGDFELQEGSEALNIGVPHPEVTIDLVGRSRDAMPDCGAYEFDGIVSTAAFQKLEGSLKILGNPVADRLQAEWHGDQSGYFQITLLNNNGKLIFENLLQKTSDILSFSIPTSKIPAGNYYLHVRQGNGIATEGFAKM